MNIVQFISKALSTSFLLSGTGRVVTQLSDFFVNSFGDSCYQTYLYENDYNCSPSFADSYHYAQDNLKGFYQFLKKNSIDVIIFNFDHDDMIAYVPEICEIAHSLNIKVIYWLHFMPGYEGYSFGSWDEVQYSITTHKNILPKTKKWLISSTQPISTSLIHKLLKDKYLPAYQHCDKIVVFSEPYVNRYLQIVGGNDRDKFAVIPNPMSFPEFLPKEELELKKKEVIYVGRLQEPQKRVSLALKIWKMVEANPDLEDWSFHIIGKGESEDFLRWMVQKNNLKRVHFEGQQDPRPYYRRASILMSTSSYEGWPMVLMEAMPMGCSCVLFNSYEAVHDFIEDGENGCIVENNDLKSFYKRLVDLMVDDDKRVEMGTQSIDSSHRFTMEIVAAKWKNLFSTMCEQI